MIFLDRVQRLIDESGISKNKLLLSIGANKSSFFDWERRQTVPGGDVVVAIADYFGVSTDYLLGRTEIRELARSEADPLLSSILSHYSGFNQEGREKLADLADDLAASGKYIKTAPSGVVAENA